MSTKSLTGKGLGAVLSISIFMVFTAPASADKALSGVWRSGDDEFEVNFDKRSVDLGPDTGCTIKSLKAEGANRWRMELTCGVADSNHKFKWDTSLQLNGSTLIFTDKDGSYPLQRSGK